MQSALGVRPEEVRRRLGGQVEQGLELGRAFGAVMDLREGVGVVVADVFVELVVLLFRHVAGGLLPDGLHGVEGLFLGRGDLFIALVFTLLGAGDVHDNGEADVVGVLTHDAPDFVFLEERVHVLAQVEGDIRAAFGAVALFEGVGAGARRGPQHGRRIGSGALGDDGDLVGGHEGGVEADPELADELGVGGLLVLLKLLEEAARPGVGDGADVGFDLLGGHADTVVADGEGAGLLVGRDLDLPGLVFADQLLVGQRLKLDAIDRIRCVRDQLAQEDLLLRIE